MDRFADLQNFIAVAKAGSLSQASRQLSTTKSVVSRRLSELEARLGTRLVKRTARGQTLTDEGLLFLERAERIVTDLAEAEEEIATRRSAPRGTLRIAAPMTFGTMYLSPAVVEFGKLYPGVAIDLEFDDRTTDLVHGGFDVAVRISRMPDSSLIARTIAPARHVVCASPAYLKEKGAPASPDELKDRDCILYSNRDVSPALPFVVGNEIRSYRVRCVLRVNNGEVLRDAAAGGLGIALIPTFIAAPAIARGELEIILGAHRTPTSTISAVYLANRHLSSKVRAFIDFLLTRFGNEPPWDQLILVSRPKWRPD